MTQEQFQKAKTLEDVTVQVDELKSVINQKLKIIYNRSSNSEDLVKELIQNIDLAFEEFYKSVDKNFEEL